MTNMLFLLFRTFFITIMTVGMMACLTEFRFGRRKLLLILAVYSVWVIGSSLVLLRMGAVFNYMTQILVSVLSASMIRWLTESLGLPGFVNVLLMCGFYFAAIYLEWRFLRQPFRMLIRVMPARWGVLTLIPCVFCVYLILVSSWPGSYLENEAQRVYVYAAIIPMTLVYIAVFKSLLAQYHIQMERQSTALLTVQITTLREKVQKVKEVEEGIRIQRHDLRHQLQTVTELVAQGDREAALDFLDAARKRLDEQKAIRWCCPPVLDTVFSSYFDQAKRQEIPVEAKISLPDALPVDEGELAIVLANALENAIHANLALPQTQRKIRCRIMASPSVMLEIANPCDGDVSFDSDGLPMARKKGHGLGVQSISAFCRKNGAVCQFDLTDGWFRLRLVL